MFFGVVGIQAIYHIFIFGRFSSSNQAEAKNPTSPISVIICAKNEAENLKANLPAILSQNHPDFEIVLINDGSSDETLDVMRNFAKIYSSIKVVNVKPVEAFWGNKKYALTLGIKAASNKTLLFTDADCNPVSNNWINAMCSKISSEKDIVLGYSPYVKVKRSFLNLLIRFETFMTAVQYVSYAKIGSPYMGVGRNLAYKKSLFFEANGFINHIKIKSGDDDLFVNQMANKKNTSICLDGDSFMNSIPKQTFKSWLIQKRRHIGTASFYKQPQKIALGLYYLSQLFFWLLAIILLVSTFNWPIVLACVIFRFMLQYIVLFSAAKILHEKDLIYYLPMLESFLILFQFYIFIHNLFSKPQHWK